MERVITIYWRDIPSRVIGRRGRKSLFKQTLDSRFDRAIERASHNPGYAQCVALEALNGRGNDKQNRFSAALCELMELPGTGGTDSHAVHDVGTVATHFESDNIHDWRDLVRELQSGRYHAVDMRTKQEVPDDLPNQAAQPR